MLKFGGLTVKQTWLWSNETFLAEIDEWALEPESAPSVSLVERLPGGRFRGNSETKSSQVYPEHFGGCIARLLQRHHVALRSRAQGWQRRVQQHSETSSPNCMDELLSSPLEGWAEASLQEVFDFMRAAR